MPDLTSAEKKIERCGAKMLLAYPWWASLYLRLRRREAKWVPTMATDGTWLLYNEAFTERIDDTECLFVLMHETAHCALLHCFRRGSREPSRWNIAADAAANALLQADGFVIPPTGVPPADLGLLAEEIYESLGDGKHGGCNRDVYDPGAFGTPDDGQADTPSLSEEYWRDALAESHGLLPAGLDRVISDSTAPTVPWPILLAQYLTSRRNADSRTWDLQSRRLPGIVPGRKREPAGVVVVCADSSGSIDVPTFTNFMGHVDAITKTSGIDRWLLVADAAVHQIVRPEEPIPASLTGGGGTDFGPAIRYAAQLSPDLIVYLTDGEGEYPPEPATPILWCLTQRKETPYGDKIVIG